MKRAFGKFHKFHNYEMTTSVKFCLSYDPLKRDCKAALLFWFQSGSSVFGSLVILEVARYYLWLSSLYINIEIDKNSCEMLD